MQWYSKMVIGKDEKCFCPNCNHEYRYGPVFDHHPRKCLNCKVELRGWNLMYALYLIDSQKASSIVQEIINYLDSLPGQEALQELGALETLFNE